jgi:hypothetical protein
MTERKLKQDGTKQAQTGSTRGVPKVASKPTESKATGWSPTAWRKKG